MDFDRKLSVQIMEGKNLQPGLYTLSIIQNKSPLFTTQSQPGPNPFWSETFHLQNPQSLLIQMNQLQNGKPRLSFTQKQPGVVGSVIIPKMIWGGRDQWYVLGNAEEQVDGQLKVKVEYFPPRGEITTHTFSITLLKVRSTSINGDFNVGLCLLLTESKQKTQQVSKQFTQLEMEETFIFMLESLPTDLQLNISLWQHDLFLGHSTLPLSTTAVEKWFPLQPKPSFIQLEFKKKKHSDPMTAVQQFMTQLQHPPSGTVSSVKHSFTQQTLLGFCHYCSGILLPNALQCLHCKSQLHPQCESLFTQPCPNRPIIRLRLSYTEIGVLKQEGVYDSLIQCLCKEKGRVSVYLGTLLSDREAFAKRMIHLQYPSLQYLSDILSLEIGQATDMETLFRANSMASKALDYFQKYIGIGYLKETLGVLLMEMVREEKAIEVDPMKSGNLAWKLLLEYFERILNCIFESAGRVPTELKQIYAHIRKEIQQKFPTDSLTRYTCISGFIFLRFFAPAILGPKLFSLVDQNTSIGPKATRTLTLLAKLLQSLANFVMFGQKESYMMPANQYIESRMADMRLFLDQICTPNTEIGEILEREEVEPVNRNQEAAYLYEILVKHTDRMIDQVSETEKPYITELLREMRKISQIMENSSNANSNRERSGSILRVERVKHRPESIVLQSRKESLPNLVSQDTAGIPSIQMRKRSLQLQHLTDTIKTHQNTLSKATSLSMTLKPKPTTGLLSPNRTNSKPALISPKPRSSRSSIVQLNDLQEVRTVPVTESGVSLDAIGSDQELVSGQRLSREILKDQQISLIVLKEAMEQAESITSSPALTLDSCQICQQTIKEEPFLFQNKKYHANCLKCFVCGKEGVTYVYDDKVLCKRDYLVMLEYICGSCGDVIDGEYIEIQDKKYHIQCKRCEICHSTLHDKHFFSFASQILCMAHKPQLSICFFCQLPIEGEILIGMKEKKGFHKSCFKCRGCDKGLWDAVYYEKEGGVFCQKCWFEKRGCANGKFPNKEN